MLALSLSLQREHDRALFLYRPVARCLCIGEDAARSMLFVELFHFLLCRLRVQVRFAAGQLLESELQFAASFVRLKEAQGSLE